MTKEQMIQNLLDRFEYMQKFNLHEKSYSDILELFEMSNSNK
jgi:hypothetical protein